MNNSDSQGGIKIRDFFLQPQFLRQMTVESFYNKYYDGAIPHKLNIQEQLDATVLDYINKHFTKVIVDSTLYEDDVAESSFWLGNQGSDYEKVMLDLSFKNDSDDNDFFVPRRERTSRKSTQGTNYISVTIAGVDYDKLVKLGKECIKHIIKEDHKIHILVNNFGDLMLRPIPVEQATADLDLNYGKDFTEKHNILIETLNNKTSGLFLFHGEPGTGKSTYIKHLLNAGIERKIAYIPVNLIDQLTSPDFLPLLMNNKNLILVIEDAEKGLVSREETNNANTALVSSILNLTDGFIGNALNISIIATFNTAKEKIDAALMRKGRLKFLHEFKPLTKEEAQKLIDSLKIQHTADGPMTLADIYYLQEDNFVKKEEPAKAIGFGS